MAVRPLMLLRLERVAKRKGDRVKVIDRTAEAGQLRWS